MTEQEFTAADAEEMRRNAKEHGFYWDALNEKQRVRYDIALGMEGIDQEIALVRIKLVELIESATAVTITVFMRAVNTLERLTKTRKTVFKTDKADQLKQAVISVLSDMPMTHEYAQERIQALRSS